MKTIRIFLASSITEFSRERMELEAFVNNLNKTYVKRGIFFELIVCEDLSNSLQGTRMQESYNAEIRNSQYFYVIFGRKAGAYTIEEFEVALESFRSKGMPRVYTYFQTLPEGQVPEQTVQDFMQRLDAELGHYYSRYNHIDTIKLNLLMEMCRDPQVGGELTLENGRASMDGDVMMTMENIPLFSKNEAVQKLIREQKELEQEFADLAALGSSEAAQRLRLRNSARRNEIAEQLHAMETDMLGLCRQIEQNRQLGKKLNWRETKALELVDAGDYEAAKSILRDNQWQAEVSRAEKLISGTEEVIRQYISGQKALIRMLKATGINTESEKEIMGIYETVCSLAAKHRTETDVLYDYADFLNDQKRYPRAVETAETLMHLYALEDAPPEKHGKLRLLLGVLYWNQNEYSKAEKCFRRALEIFRGLPGEESEASQDSLAGACHQLAGLLMDTEHYGEAEALNGEALSIRRRLAGQDPELYEGALASSCARQGGILWHFKRYGEAEQLYRESLDIRRKRAENGSAERRCALAYGCRNLGGLLREMDRYADAEELYQEALAIFARLAEQNPAAYEESLSGIYSRLAGLYWETRHLDQSETYFRKTIEISRRLAEENPAAFEPGLASDCHNMALLLEDMGKREEAGDLYQEALAIYRKLAEENPEVYMESVADCCGSLAMFLEDRGEKDRAEELFTEQLSVYRRMEEKEPQSADYQIARTCNNLANFYQMRSQYRKAEPIYLEAMEIFRRLSEDNPSVYEDALASSCMNLGALYRTLDRYAEAEPLMRECLQVRRREAEENAEVYREDLGMACHALAVLLEEMKQQEEAEFLYREALDIDLELARRYPETYNHELETVRGNFVKMLKKQGRREEAEQVSEQYANICRTDIGTGDDGALFRFQ